MISTLASATDLPDIAAPKIEYALLAPLFIIAGAAVLGVVVEAFWPRASRFVVQAGIAVVGIVAALADTVWVFQDLDVVDSSRLARGTVAAEGALAIDGVISHVGKGDPSPKTPVQIDDHAAQEGGHE